jgi:phage terminase large subunit-like protein
MNSRDHTEIALNYAVDVANGEISACLYIVQACVRFLDDLERSDWCWIFDPDRANRACRFMELLPHTKGAWAAKKQRLVLEPWQCFIECNLFGWIHRDSGLRRFTESYEEVPRKNGKSIRLAARGMYLFAADGEAGAEVYSGATTEKQAHEIFRPAWQMVQRLPELRERYNLEQSGTAKNPGPMFVMSDLSRFETVIGKPGDGASPHGALVDEYHEHQGDDLVETMQTGMGSREQPLLSIITTAGSNLAGPCYAKRREAIAMLDGSVPVDRLFAAIYTIDQGDAWDDPAVLKKANPNYGVSVYEDYLLAQLDQARRSSTKQNAFRTKHLNEWVGARTVWMNMLVWQRQRAQVDLDELREYPCWMAVDLASKKDVAALVLLFEKDRNYYVVPFFFVPESAVEENPKYREYVTAGDMIETPGTMTDYAFIEQKIIDLHAEFDVQDVAFDDWQANYLMSRLMERRGIQVVNYNQTVRNMSDPMKEVEAQALAGTLHHDGNQAMFWMMGNVSAKMDAKENVYPRKENEADPQCKIDGPVALIMAMGRALLAGREAEKEYQVLIV